MSALCVIGDVTGYTGKSDATSVAVFNALIPQASAFIENFCNRTFASASYTETRNGNNGRRMVMRQQPITAVASVLVDTVSIPAAPDARSFGFVFDEFSVYIREDGKGVAPVTTTGDGVPRNFARGIQNVVIAYTAGYGAIPADIVQACVELIAFKFAKRDRIDKKNEQLAQQTVGFDMSDMPEQVKTVLLRHQIPMWAP